MLPFKLVYSDAYYLPIGAHVFPAEKYRRIHDQLLAEGYIVGKVGSGFTNAVRKEVNRLLWSRLRPKPVIPCKLKGKWIEPGLFCRVRFMERTESGDLRAPAFKELIVRE